VEEFDPDLYDFTGWGDGAEYEPYYLVINGYPAYHHPIDFLVITKEEYVHEFGLVLSALFL